MHDIFERMKSVRLGLNFNNVSKRDANKNTISYDQCVKYDVSWEMGVGGDRGGYGRWEYYLQFPLHPIPRAFPSSQYNMTLHLYFSSTKLSVQQNIPARSKMNTIRIWVQYSPSDEAESNIVVVYWVPHSPHWIPPRKYVCTIH